MADTDSSNARVVSRPKKNFSWLGWQTTPQRGAGSVASIANRYGPQPDKGIEGEEAASGSPPAAVPAPAINPAINPAPVATNPFIGQEQFGPPAPGPIGEMFGPPAPGPAPTGPVINENTGTPAAPVRKTPEEIAAADQQDWIAQGGSVATMHRAQTKGGYRPAIDARTGQPQQPSASDAIRAGWGWPATKFGNQGGAIWADMTKDFQANPRVKAQQAQSQAKFDAARQQFQQSFGNE